MWENDPAGVESLLPSLFPHTKKQDENNPAPENGSSSEKAKYPEILPILPLRGVVVYPTTAVPLTVGQPRSIRLVDDVTASESKLVGLVAARDRELEQPGPNDLHTTGTIATVHRLLRAPDGTVRLLVQGLERFRLGEFVQEEPYLSKNPACTGDRGERVGD